MATEKELAKLAEFSSGTVSNVISGSARVSERSRQKVLEVIRKLDYRPNLIDRGLKTNRMHTLGMVVPDITIPSFPRVIRGAESAARKRGYLLSGSGALGFSNLPIVCQDRLPEHLDVAKMAVASLAFRACPLAEPRGLLGIKSSCPYQRLPEGNSSFSAAPGDNLAASHSHSSDSRGWSPPIDVRCDADD
jgi:hypothetical protein